MVGDFMKNIVNTNMSYDYSKMEQDILQIKKEYPFINVNSIGKSVLGKELYCIIIGEGENEVLFNGAHHSLEWITALLLMKFTEKICCCYKNKIRLYGYDINNIFKNSKIYIVPMVNPDGVDLVINGLSKNNPNYEKLILFNKGSSNFSKNWQANANGVDLNHNYDALFELSKKAEKQNNIKGPGPTRFSGTRPFSEPETRALAMLTGLYDFRLVIAFHSQGEVIYYDLANKEPKESFQIAKMLSKESGYMTDKPSGMASFAGYKDWFIERFKKPGFTVEVGSGVNPLPLSQFGIIFEKNAKIMLLASII